jgi:hypothetical protein
LPPSVQWIHIGLRRDPDDTPIPIEPHHRHTLAFEITYPQANVTRMRVAAVKSACLAACAAMRAVPRSPRAGELRSELLALRDVSHTKRPQLSPLMKSIQIARTAAEPAPGEIVLMAGAGAEKTSARFVISFNRSSLSTGHWSPSRDFARWNDPHRGRPLRAHSRMLMQLSAPGRSPGRPQSTS